MWSKSTVIELLKLKLVDVYFLVLITDGLKNNKYCCENELISLKSKTCRNVIYFLLMNCTCTMDEL